VLAVLNDVFSTDECDELIALARKRLKPSTVVDPATGRGIGSTSITGSGSALYVMYIVNPNRVVTFRTPAQNRSAVMDWLDAN